MPWASQAQRRKFLADPKLRKYVAEYDAATPNLASLPGHVKFKHRHKLSALAANLRGGR